MLIMAFMFTIGLFAIVFPDSSVGRFVAGLFVRRGKPLSMAKIALLMLSFLVIATLATVCPLDLALLADLTAYSEFLLAAVIGLSRVRLRHLSEATAKAPQWLSAKTGGLLRKVRATRARRIRRPARLGKRGDGDADGAGWAFA
jgi:hypothetical protein